MGKTFVLSSGMKHGAARRSRVPISRRLALLAVAAASLGVLAPAGCSRTIDDPALQPTVDRLVRRKVTYDLAAQERPRGKVILVDEKSLKVHKWQERLPEAWRARRSEDVTGLVFLEEGSTTSGSLSSYFVSHGGPSGVRTRHTLSAMLVNAATHTVVRQTVLSGRMPSRGRPRAYRSSSIPGHDELVDWLETAD
jgi:hypothetical protein